MDIVDALPNLFFLSKAKRWNSAQDCECCRVWAKYYSVTRTGRLFSHVLLLMNHVAEYYLSIQGNSDPFPVNMKPNPPHCTALGRAERPNHSLPGPPPSTTQYWQIIAGPAGTVSGSYS